MDVDAKIVDHLVVKRDTTCKRIDRKAITAHNAGRLWKFKQSEIDVWGRSGNAGEPTN